MSKWLGAVFALGALLSTPMILTTTPSSAQALTSGVRPGLVVDLTWGISSADIDRTVTQLKDSGAKWVRTNVNWKDLEPAPGSMNPWWLSTVDSVVGKLQTAGIQVLMPISDGVPYWASADPNKYVDSSGAQHWNQYWKPLHNQDYASFASRMAARYAPKGVHTFEVWNEPNISRFWPSGPNPNDYAALLAAAYPAIKAADPKANVVMGGVSTNDYTFIEGLYAAGAGGSFDVAAVHPYSGSTSPTVCWNDPGTTTNSMYAFCGLASVHQVMAAHGDVAKPIWLTEFGWSTCACQTGVTEAQQASYLASVFSQLASYPYVTAAFVYNLRNDSWLGNDPSNVEADYGLLRTDFSQKAAYAAYKKAATPLSGG